MKSPRIGKRTLLMFLLLISGGAIINIAVAWGCALWSPIQLQKGPLVNPPTTQEADWWRIKRPPQATADALAVWHMAGWGCDSFMIMGDRSRQALLDVRPDQTTLNLRQTSLLDRVVRVRSGFPLRALGGEEWDFGFTGATRILMVGMPPTAWRSPDLRSSTISIDRPRLLGGSSYRVFGYRPLWPGFAINTLFYAAILWILLVVPFALRRRRRIKRGLCPACAYPVGESSVCTECGRPTSAR